MNPKYLYINTIGCQMNVYDSQQIQHRLAPLGFNPTDELSRADVILVNTCSIRAKAEQKAFSFLGRLAPLKEFNPQLIVGVGGCVAQQQGRAIFKRMPHVDLVFGTQAVVRLPQMIERITATRRRILDVDMDETPRAQDFALGTYPYDGISAFVTIMRGCDNYCTYCVVPYVRGREASRPEEDILNEIRHLVLNGVREVTLLGQNVNSYGLKEGRSSFAQLLTDINAVEGLDRVRFTTSHPKDLSEELIGSFTRLDKLCPHIHLPVQSGSNAVLDRMNRRYTREDYLHKAALLRSVCPDIAITSDIIVGFPGETDADFQQTLELIAQVEFDNLFAFIYSDRPDAPASHFRSKVPDAVKKERLQEVLASQKGHTLTKNKALVGSIQKVLVDGLSKNQPANDGSTPEALSTAQKSWSGRTATNKIVHFIKDAPQPFPNQTLTGRLMDIMIERVMPHCLWGRPLDRHDEPLGKGV